jgi:5,5'-dehydrodivanillate O-demethylase
VPIDDTHTKIFFVRFDPTEDGSFIEDETEPTVEHVPSYKTPQSTVHPFTRFRMDEVQAQDHMAWETQGPLTDRSTERLGTADKGIVLYRTMLRREIERVQEGLDPKNVIRDPDHAVIDTKLTESIEELKLSGSSQLEVIRV